MNFNDSNSNLEFSVAELGSLDDFPEIGTQKDSDDSEFKQKGGHEESDENNAAVAGSIATLNNSNATLNGNSDVNTDYNDPNSNKSETTKTSDATISRQPYFSENDNGGKGKKLCEMERISLNIKTQGTSADANGQSNLSENKPSTDDVNNTPIKSDPNKDPSKADPNHEVGNGAAGDNLQSQQSALPTRGDVVSMASNVSNSSSRTMAEKCLPIIQKLIDLPQGWVFRDAVDPDLFKLPDYFDVVKNPMHLSLVEKKLKEAVYIDMVQFEQDVKLVFENAILYNGEESDVGSLAKTMQGVFETEYTKLCEGG